MTLQFIDNSLMEYQEFYHHGDLADKQSESEKYSKVLLANFIPVSIFMGNNRW